MIEFYSATLDTRINTMNSNTEIVHIMKNLTDPDGIPNFPCYIPFYLCRREHNINYILVTRECLQPDIKQTNNLPHVKFMKNTAMIIKEIINNKPDLLIIYHHFGSPLTSMLLIISKILHIKTIAQPDFNGYLAPRIHRSISKTIKDFMRVALIFSQILLFDKIVGATKYEIDSLSKIKKLSVCYYSIIPWGTNFDLCTYDKDNYILTVSKWWRDRKNLHSALKVVSEVLKEKELKLIIVGKFFKGKDNEFEMMYNESMTGEEYEAKIMGLIEDLGIKDHVEFTGVVSSEELQSLYRHARVYYMPTKFETFGGVFVEAMASGTPIVAMKNSAVQYVVQDGVTGFLRDTEEGQKEAILKLFSDEALYREMQANCLKAAERYKWDNVIKLWEDLIDELTE